MKVLLATVGSRGDVQPLISLSLALSGSGHDVLLCTPPEHGEWIESYGCTFQPVGGNVMSYIESHGDTSSLKALLSLIRFMQAEIRSQVNHLTEILRDYSADMFIGSSLLLGGSLVAEAHNLPYAYIAFCPQMFPSRHHPMIHVRNQNLPGWLNRLSWWVFRRLDIDFNYRGIINDERAKLSLAPIKSVYRHHLLHGHVIVAADELLAPVPDDVAEAHTQIGYCHLQQTSTLPAELRAFLAEGPPPVFVGFGSMPTETPVADTCCIIEAARAANVRLILSKGWAGLGGEELGEDVFLVGNVPHELLFAEVAAVVHHGGAGTTATAARTGTPQVVVPHLMDQFYWAHQVASHHLGPAPIRRPQLTLEGLASAIKECLTTRVYRDNARAFAERLRRQHPQQRGVETIEWLYENCSRNPNGFGDR